MEICLVLVLEDTNDLSVDMPAILESSYRPCEAHKLVLVAIGVQNHEVKKKKNRGKRAHDLINPIVLRTTPSLDPMACIDFARAILEFEHVRGYLACHTHYLRYNRNLPAAKQPYQGALIAGSSERVAVWKTEISSAPLSMARHPVQTPRLQCVPA